MTNMTENFYSEESVGVATLESIESSINYNSWIASTIYPFLGEKNIELGSGLGTISNYILKNHKVFLTELSHVCRNELSLRFSNNDNLIGIIENFYDISDKNKYDCVYSCNVMEHIEDDLKIIEHSHNILKQGGYFVAFVPAHRILLSPFDQSIGHFRRYDLSDKERLLRFFQNKKIGFELVSFDFYNPIGAIAWFIKMKLLRSTKIDEKDAILFDKLFPLFQKFNFISRIFNFGQNARIVLKKMN